MFLDTKRVSFYWESQFHNNRGPNCGKVGSRLNFLQTRKSPRAGAWPKTKAQAFRLLVGGNFNMEKVRFGGADYNQFLVAREKAHLLVSFCPLVLMFIFLAAVPTKNREKEKKKQSKS